MTQKSYANSSSLWNAQRESALRFTLYANILYSQSERITHRVEHLHEAARLLPRMVGDGVAYVTVLSKGLAREGRYRDDDPEGNDL